MNSFTKYKIVLNNVNKYLQIDIILWSQWHFTVFSIIKSKLNKNI